ncbi:hypothetical protein A0H76_58 [Hepatospora eriocheir]|uniref:Uncharacterized protein n=1 Tax=Hepatospora eriocheir TaxID=1081669 RepID=A0A1X0QEK9_9MICR|nr:hypothetical protein A0H76_58 [Hepatospora eriocheir]
MDEAEIDEQINKTSMILHQLLSEAGINIPQSSENEMNPRLNDNSYTSQSSYCEKSSKKTLKRYDEIDLKHYYSRKPYEKSLKFESKNKTTRKEKNFYKESTDENESDYLELLNFLEESDSFEDGFYKEITEIIEKTEKKICRVKIETNDFRSLVFDFKDRVNLENKTIQEQILLYNLNNDSIFRIEEEITNHDAFYYVYCYVEEYAEIDPENNLEMFKVPHYCKEDCEQKKNLSLYFKFFKIKNGYTNNEIKKKYHFNLEWDDVFFVVRKDKPYKNY